MPTVSRKRRVSAPAADIWGVISDPYHLPRWWPNTTRVESVTDGGHRGRRWTAVLTTKEGRGVRADFRCTAATEQARYVFEQEIEGTPFAAFMKSSSTEIKLHPAGPETEVSVEVKQQLKGLSRFGAMMMKRATRRMIGDALEGLDEAVAPPGPA